MIAKSLIKIYHNIDKNKKLIKNNLYNENIK